MANLFLFPKVISTIDSAQSLKLFTESCLITLNHSLGIINMQKNVLKYI